MVFEALDPRTGGGCVTLLSKIFFSYVVGYVQLIIWVISFFTIVFHPSSVTAVVQNADTTSMVIAGFLSLFCIAFSVILLIGLHKDRRLYVKAYLIYAMVHLFLLALAIVINIFVQPKTIGFRGFFSMVFSILLNLFFAFVIRCYYLVAYCSGANRPGTNLSKV